MLGSLYRGSIAAFLQASLAVGLGGIAGSLGGCASHDPSSAERVGHVRTPIVGGEPSAASQDAVVMLVLADAAANKRGVCTAVLLAPRLILTARHCVAEADAEVACGADGRAVLGGDVRAAHDARTLHVFTGTDRPDLNPTTWKPAARGLEVLDDGSDNLCNHDLALVVLEEPITGVPIAAIRLEGDVEPGERLTTVGWGVTSVDEAPAARQQRSGVLVTRLGPDAEEPALAPNEFGFDESICLGDSGGPIFSETTAAVIGVVSRGGNGTSSRNLASTCTRAFNLGTRLAPFRDLLVRGFERAGAQPLLEEPKPAAPEAACSVAPAGTRSAPSTFGLASVASLALLALARLGRREGKA